MKRFPKPLRVLLVSPVPPPSGGIGRWTVLLLSWLQLQSSVATRVVDISPRWREVEDLGIWKRALGGAIQGFRDAMRCLYELLFFRPDVMHVNSSAQLRGPWDTLMLAVAACLGVTSIYHLRMGRLPEIVRSRGWEWWGMRLALKIADRVLVLDQASEQALLSVVPTERVARLPNAIQVPQHVDVAAKSPSPDIRTVLYLGHILPTKGMRELMEAWREVNSGGWRLRLGGRGSKTYQRELLNILGCETNVQFLGDLKSDQAWTEMMAADIFVLPTYTEGFPNVLLEAMAAGKPTVSTRVGAIAEMLDADGDKPCGLVVSPRDVEELSSALRRLMFDPQLRETLGQQARNRVATHYTTDVVFARLLGLWRDANGGGWQMQSGNQIVR